MKTILAASLIALGWPLAASAADLSGVWTVKADFGPKLQYALVCAFHADGPAVSGPCVATQGRTLRGTGRLGGEDLSFSYLTDYNGSGLRLDYTGKVAPDGAVKGKVENRLAQGEFHGKSLIDSGADQPRAWLFSAAFPGPITYDVVCAFNPKGANLRGPCAVTDGVILHGHGSMDGSGVTFGYDTEFQGKPVHVDYTGAWQPDGSLKGTAKAGDATGAFTAARP